MSPMPQPESNYPPQPLVCLVTGASRGLGRGIALALGEVGAVVYITGRSAHPNAVTDPVAGSLAETQAQVEKLGGSCVAIPLDQGDDAQLEPLFQRIQREQGRLDVLVNNAYGGVRSLRDNQGKPFWEAEAQLWDDCNHVGLRSHYLVSRLGAQIMVSQGQGLIITLSSWGGLGPIFGVAYGVGKTACDRLAADMAQELKPHGVTSLSLWPGIVGTEHFLDLAQQSPSLDPQDPALASLRDRFNWETPRFTGRVIAKLAQDPRVLRRSGHVQIVAELAGYYGITDEEGRCPASLRSLRFLLPSLIPTLKPWATAIPDLRIPWWILLNLVLASPRP